MDQKLENLEKIDGKQNLKSIVMNGVRSGKVGKLEKVTKEC